MIARECVHLLARAREQERERDRAAVSSPFYSFFGDVEKSFFIMKTMLDEKLLPFVFCGEGEKKNLLR